ncbi:MAG: HDIG domain-containing protein [Clostridium butyricum]|nr:HDIG domain-containing protein [Clostridium butyricum]
MTEKEKKIFMDIENHLLNDKKPSLYLKDLLKKGTLSKYPFSIIGDLKTVGQNPKYHPEGSVFNHTMMVVDEGAQNRQRSNNKRVFMWTLLLHDIGKKPTTKMRNGRLTSYNHDIVGKDMARKFLEYFNEDEEVIKEITGLIRWHMQSLFVSKNNSRFKNINDMLKDVDKNEIILVATADRLGRGNSSDSEREQIIKDIEKFKKVIINS